MANLWRTQRPRFPLYQSDGFGRDYYIKYTNGGFWEDQFVLTKKPDYTRTKYNNFHSLFHMAAPFKYWGDGSGRENYILKCNGFYHDQKPLCSYELTDFLRNGKNFKGTPDNHRKKLYLSVSEMKYNRQLKNIEKKLLKRLYTDPMKKKKKITIEIDCGNKDKYGNKINLNNIGFQTCGQFNTNKYKNFKTFDNKESENLCNNKLLKRTKTLENNNLLPKYQNNLKFYEFKTFENTFNENNNDFKKKKKIKKFNFFNSKNNKDIKNKNESDKNIDDTLEFKKAIVNSKLVNKRIKIV